MFNIFEKINFFFFSVKKYIYIALAFLALYLLKKYFNLINETESLRNKLKEINVKVNNQQNVIQTQEKVIDTINSIEDVDLKSNIKRMRKGEF
jgi:hypothetical protein